jgi:hypothetical protein
VREAASNAQCKNHLKQIGLATHNFHDGNGYFPTHGSGGTITRINGIPATATSNPPQAAGFFFQILPYIEQDNVYKLTDDAAIRATPIRIYFCPARRGPTVRTNAAGGNVQALLDYAVPMHGLNPATGTGNCWGFRTDASITNGIIVRGGLPEFPPGRIADITDGTSNTLMISEGALSTTHYQPPVQEQDVPPPEWVNNTTCNGWVAQGTRMDWMISAYTAGWASWGLTRCAMNGPWRDEPHYPNCRAIWQQLGSAHPAGINAVAGDGSVRMYKYGVPHAILQLLVRKNDGIVISDPSSF